MISTPAASGMHKDDEAILSLDSTPMIGVLMALIAMLVMALPAEIHRLDFSVPSCYSLDRPIEASRVDIDFDGSLYWDGEAVSASQMEHNFHMLALRQDLAQFVHLRASHATSYQQVLAVFASARRAGLNNIGIVNDGLLPS